jgi:formate dehydrogenase (coenzyme F420) beta subunit
MMNTVIPVENQDVLGAVRGFLQQLLTSGLVAGVFVPLEVGEAIVAPALVTDPTRLAAANPLMPIMPINNARAVSALTGKHTPARLAVVLRPCEIRAFIELVKFQQANLENVLVIGFDCPGTYELAEYQENASGGRMPLSDYLAAASKGETPNSPISLRPACRMCAQPLPEQADVQIRLVGVDSSQGLTITIPDDAAERLQWPGVGLGQVPIDEAMVNAQPVLERFIDSHRKLRERERATILARMNADGGVAGIFAACIRCHNCMTACPICYCKTCLFRTVAFDHPPETYLKAAAHKGAVRMLGDTLLFHMTRLNHMSASCVNCGMCTSACPSDIPVGTVFSAIGERVQAAFDYLPGRDVAEPLPLITFQADEWVEIGEAR